MHNEQKEMIISTLEDIKYSLELVQKRAKNIKKSTSKKLSKYPMEKCKRC